MSITSYVAIVVFLIEICVTLQWPLTPKLDRATRLFLKFDMRHGANRHATGLSKKE